MKVQEIMTSQVESCRPETNLAEAAKTMWDNDCGALPVVDETGKVISLITDRDICIAVATQGRLAVEIVVGEVITGDIYACEPDDEIEVALKTMRQEKVRRLPVVKSDGTLGGILSMNDVVLCAEADKGNQRQGLSYTDVMKTLKAICAHRSATPDEKQRQPSKTARA